MIYATLDQESLYWKSGITLICGVDEVGRGCFAGPVVAGAVVLSSSCKMPEGIADSKLLKPKKRVELAKAIKDCVESWSVGEASVQEINEIGIGKATQLAFNRAIDHLLTPPDFILIDAFYIDGVDREKQKPIIDGDKLCISIAAASILAKVYRDELMEKLGEEYPQYQFGKHKGYGTRVHQEAIKEHGLCELHRTSFNLEKFL